jgi:rhodanese-related sulfurtransferase
MAEDERPREVTRLTPDEANIRLDAGGMTLIDVGEESQLRDRGTIPGARNIPHDEIGGTARGQTDPALADQHARIILTCGGGGKAKVAAGILQEMGFTDVSIIDGGCRGWQKAGFELEPYPAPISGMASSRSNK